MTSTARHEGPMKEKAKKLALEATVYLHPHIFRFGVLMFPWGRELNQLQAWFRHVTSLRVLSTELTDFPSLNDQSSVQDPIDKLRNLCLARGASGIKGLSRAFRIMDDDGNKKISFTEFKKGLHDYGLRLSGDKVVVIFAPCTTCQWSLKCNLNFIPCLPHALGFTNPRFYLSRINTCWRQSNSCPSDSSSNMSLSLMIQGVQGNLYKVRHERRWKSGLWRVPYSLAGSIIDWCDSDLSKSLQFSAWSFPTSS